MPKYLNPKVDLVVKRIFGEYPHLLNSLFKALLPLASALNRFEGLKL